MASDHISCAQHEIGRPFPEGQGCVGGPVDIATIDRLYVPGHYGGIGRIGSSARAAPSTGTVVRLPFAGRGG
jgi:hypothetical protein